MGAPRHLAAGRLARRSRRVDQRALGENGGINQVFVDRPTPGRAQLGHLGAMFPERDRGAGDVGRPSLDIAILNSREDPREIARVVFGRI